MSGYVSELTEATIFASRFLDKPNEDPDSDVSRLSRQFLRSLECIEELNGELEEYKRKIRVLCEADEANEAKLNEYRAELLACQQRTGVYAEKPDEAKPKDELRENALMPGAIIPARTIDGEMWVKLSDCAAMRSRAEGVADGWQLVPKMHTEEMRDAFNDVIGDCEDFAPAYQALLAAAPSPGERE